MFGICFHAEWVLSVEDCRESTENKREGYFLAFVGARQHTLVLSVCSSLEMLIIALGSRNCHCRFSVQEKWESERLSTLLKVTQPTLKPASVSLFLLGSYRRHGPFLGGETCFLQRKGMPVYF